MRIHARYRNIGFTPRGFSLHSALARKSCYDAMTARCRWMLSRSHRRSIRLDLTRSWRAPLLAAFLCDLRCRLSKRRERRAAECMRWRKILELIFRRSVLDRPLITRMATRCENPALLPSPLFSLYLIGVHLLDPSPSSQPPYSEMDGTALD